MEPVRARRKLKMGIAEARMKARELRANVQELFRISHNALLKHNGS